MKKVAISLLAFTCGTGSVLADTTEIVSLDGADRVVQALDARMSANGRTISFGNFPSSFDQIFARIRHPLPASTVMVTQNYLDTGGADPALIDPLRTGQVALSDSGRFAVFTSNGCDITDSHQCENVDPSLGFAPFNVYRRDLDLGVTKLVSKSVVDGSGNHLDCLNCGYTGDPLISEDGIWVAFDSYATDLAPAGTPSHPGFRDVYLQNVETQSFTRLVSSYRPERCDALVSAGDSWLGDMVPFGRFVVFVSNAPHLRGCLDDYVYELFVWDNRSLVLHRTGQVVAGPESILEDPTNAFSAIKFAAHPSISDDGRYIAFVDGNLGINVYDMHTDSTIFLGVTGPLGYFPLISGNGEKVAFQSDFALVLDDTNGVSDVYVMDVATGSVELASRPPVGIGDGASTIEYAGGLASRPFFPILIDGERPGAVISWDGRFVAFTSNASNMTPLDNNLGPEVFVRDTLSGETRLASVTPSGEVANAANIQLDATGNLAVFQAASYVPETPNLVTVVLQKRPPTQQIVDLKESVIELNLRNGISSSLDGKLTAVDQALNDAQANNDVAAIAALEAFIKTVEAQRGISLTDTEADQLIAAAQSIINLII